jgi:3-hydroxy-3-methylglutaryl CoA synthase
MAFRTATPALGAALLFGASEKSEAELVVAGDKLEAKGIKLASGAMAVSSLVAPAAKVITVRFTVK